MNNIQVLPVRTARERRAFLTFPWRIYKGDPLWVPPLLSERAKSIDPQRGLFFRDGYAELFIAWRNGKPAGTIICAEEMPSLLPAASEPSPLPSCSGLAETACLRSNSFSDIGCNPEPASKSRHEVERGARPCPVQRFQDRRAHRHGQELRGGAGSAGRRRSR